MIDWIEGSPFCQCGGEISTILCWQHIFRREDGTVEYDQRIRLPDDECRMAYKLVCNECQKEYEDEEHND